MNMSTHFPVKELNIELLKLVKDINAKQLEKQTLAGIKVLDTIILLLNKLKSDLLGQAFSSDGFSGENLKTLVYELEMLLIVDTNKGVTAEEYAFYWYQQQLIRETIYSHLLLSKQFYSPYLNYSMQKLIKHYDGVRANLGSTVKVEIVGDAVGVWYLEKQQENWSFVEAIQIEPTVTIYLDQQIAWLLFNNLVDVQEAQQYYQIIGERALGLPLLTLKN